MRRIPTRPAPGRTHTAIINGNILLEPTISDVPIIPAS
jgi:hypothetical protein